MGSWDLLLAPKARSGDGSFGSHVHHDDPKQRKEKVAGASCALVSAQTAWHRWKSSSCRLSIEEGGHPCFDPCRDGAMLWIWHIRSLALFQLIQVFKSVSLWQFVFRGGSTVIGNMFWHSGKLKLFASYRKPRRSWTKWKIGTYAASCVDKMLTVHSS